MFPLSLCVCVLQFRGKDFLACFLRKSAGKTTKYEDGKSQDDTICSWDNHVEHEISTHGSSNGVCGLTLCDQRTAENCTRGQSAGYERVTGLQVTQKKIIAGQSGVNDPLGQNAEGTLSHGNLIPFREDTDEIADSDCKVCACSPTAINQALSLPSFHASHYGNKLNSDLISSTGAMFTSSLVSVLAPHWSGRLRRHKRGFSDAGSDIAQNTNLSPSSQQQRLPRQQIQTQGELGNDFSTRPRGSAGTSRSCFEWQNESFSHLSESKKMFSKTSSLRMNRHVVDQRPEFGNPVHVSADSSEVSRSTLSLQLSNNRRMAQSVDQGESFSSLRSRPTTSTLLLSSRRLNSRKPSPESFQMQKQLSASISSINLPSNSLMRISQPQPNLVSPTDPAKDTLVTKNIPASPGQLSGTPNTKPFSPKWEEMDSSRTQHYLITGDSDTINRTPPATNDTARERMFSRYTRFNRSETLSSGQDQRAVARTGNINLQDSNSKIPERSFFLSPKEDASSRFVFPQKSLNPNTDGILMRQISKTSITNTNLDPSTSVQSNRSSLMINSNKTGSINNTTSPRTLATSLSISLSPVPLSQADQNKNCSLSPVNSIKMRTFTDSLSFSPRKDSPVEGTSPSPLWSNYLNSKRQLKESNQHPLNQPGPLSPSDFKPRRVCTPSIYKYLRETSPSKSTEASPALSSPSPQTVSLKQIQGKNSRNLWFTFDLSPVETHDPLSTPDSSSRSPPQSLPPETSRRSLSHISKSPYSTLISTRAAVNSLSSPPGTRQHSRSFSYGGSTVDTKSPTVEKRSYTSVLRERMSQSKSPSAEPVGLADIQITAKVMQGVLESSTDAKSTDCQTNTLIPDSTHPKLADTVTKKGTYEGHNGPFLSQDDKNNTCAADRLNTKELSVSLGPSPGSEAVHKGSVTEILQTNETFQASESPNSKKSLFSLRSKKDNVLASAPSADKDSSAVKKGEITGNKTTRRMDQVLNRLRLTFGGKLSDDNDLTSRRKTKKEEASNDKACENIKKEKEIDDLTVKRQTKPEELLDSKASERTMTLDQMVDLKVKTQTKPEKLSQIKAPKGNIKLEQTDDLTVRTKIRNETQLDITSETKRTEEQRLPARQTLKSPHSPNISITFMIDSATSPGPVLGFRQEKQDNLTNMDKHVRLIEENRHRFLGPPVSPNWPRPDNNSFYATLPPGKRSRFGPSPTPFECSSEDEQNDNVFFSNVLTKRNNSSLGEPESVAQPDSHSLKVGAQNSTGGVLPSLSTDLKYGLQRGRSVSVSSVVSGRPSGPGRISTGSRQGSISDLNSLDGFVTKSRDSSFNSPVGSPESDTIASSGHFSYKGPTGRLPSEGRPRSPNTLEALSFPWDTEGAPTPPPSPVHTRRVSQVPSPSSPGNRSSPDSLSPRGRLPSRNYKSILSDFEESGSETTTDDEYYLNSDDDDQKETEL